MDTERVRGGEVGAPGLRAGPDPGPDANGYVNGATSYGFARAYTDGHRFRDGYRDFYAYSYATIYTDGYRAAAGLRQRVLRPDANEDAHGNSDAIRDSDEYADA